MLVPMKGEQCAAILAGDLSGLEVGEGWPMQESLVNMRTADQRATLFTLRYPGLGKYSEETLAMLLEWHADDEVGEYERHRNAAIFERQGNRNPLVDHPEWASGIEFSGGL